MTQALSLITPARAAELLRNNGYRAKIEHIDRNVSILSSAQGTNFRILFYDPSPTKEDDVCSSFHFVAFWRLNEDDVPSVIQMCNMFNTEARYAKSGVAGEKGDRAIFLEADCYAFDGISDGAFNGFVELFTQFIGDFMQKSRNASK